MEDFRIEMQIGTVAHTDKIRAQNAATACKKAVMKIKTTIQNLECTKPTAEVFRVGGIDLPDMLIAKFTDLRLLLK